MSDFPLARPSTAVLSAGLAGTTEGTETSQPLPCSRWTHWISVGGLIAADKIAFAASALLIMALRQRIWGGLLYAPGLMEMGVAWLVLRLGTGLYPGFGLSPVEELQKSVTTTGIAALAHTALLFAAQAATASRFVVLLTWALLVLLSWALRCGSKALLVHLQRFGAPVVIIGAGESGTRLVGELRKNPGLGLIPVAFFDDDPVKRARIVAGVPVLGTVAGASNASFDYSVSHVLFAIPSLSGQKLAELVRLMSSRYPRVGVIRDMFGLVDLSLRPRYLGACSVLEVRNNLLDPANMMVKRSFDLLVSLPLTIFTLPIVLVAGLLVKLANPGPAFYLQKREGLGGLSFRVWKIRTMVVDAERVLDTYLVDNAQARLEWEQHMKLRADPRIVPLVGRALRRFCIDELPQLWNVLKGEMSLVGPRPFPIYHLAQFGKEFRTLRRQAMPGMTGLWQVTCRSEGNLLAQESMDRHYIRNWSLWIDFWVLMRTVAAVVAGRGAH